MGANCWLPGRRDLTGSQNLKISRCLILWLHMELELVVEEVEVEVVEEVGVEVEHNKESGRLFLSDNTQQCALSQTERRIVY